ncbi:MAG: hypothetical protein V1847_01040 [Candidatus Diapherotrites archaeon]
MSQFRMVFAPGIIAHEFSHWLSCSLLGVRVHKVEWYGMRAFVQHDHPSPFNAWLITLAPLLFGQTLGFGLLLYASSFYSVNFLLSLFLAWMGISVLLFSFPSSHDVSNAFKALQEAYSRNFKKSVFHQLLALFSLPFVALPLSVLLAFFWILDSVWILRGAWALYAVYFAFQFPAIFL